MNDPRTVSYAQIGGEQYVNVKELVAALRLQGEDRAADMLEESVASEPISEWTVPVR